jgi:Flp pilus assembly protein CpaB
MAMSRQFGGSSKKRSDNRTVIIAVFGIALLLILGLFAVVIFSSGETGAPAEPIAAVEPVAADTDKVDVVIPIRQIPSASELQPAMFRIEKRSKVGIDEGVVTNIDDVKGLFAKSLILQNQPLHRDFLTNMQPKSEISADIPPGYRAITITVNRTSSVEGWAVAGSRVDVAWASNVAGAPALTTIVQNAKVLATDRQVDKSNPELPVPSTVTLLVSTKDAQKIQLAQTAGELSLSLRGDLDPGKEEQGGTVSIGELLGTDRAPVAEVPNAQGTVVIGGKKWIVGGDGRMQPMGGQ